MISRVTYRFFLKESLEEQFRQNGNEPKKKKGKNGKSKIKK